MKVLSLFSGIGGFDLGFPDDWTLVDGMSDSQRYKQLGNAVCVSVAEWIGNRIMMVEKGEL